MTTIVDDSVVERLLRRLLAPADDAPWTVPGLAPAGEASAPSSAVTAAQSAVAGVVAQPATGRPADVSALFRLAAQVQALALRELAEMEATGSFAGVGAIAASTWLRDDLLLTDDGARAQVRLATALRDDVPQVAELLHEGGTTLDHARAAVAGTRGLDRSVVREAQPAICDLLRSADPATVRAQLRERAEAVDPELGREAERRAHARRGVTADAIPSGVVLGGSLGVEDGHVLLHGLDLAVEADRTDGDPRSLRQRRADVLVQWAREAAARLAPAASGEADDLRTARTHLLLSCTLDQLAALTAGRSRSVADDVTGGWPWTPGGQVGAARDPGALVFSAVVRRLACDAVVSLAVTAPPEAAEAAAGPLGDLRPAPATDPLYVGRAARVVNGRQWRALVHRDRRCVVKGCRRRPAQCQAHHVVHWLDGGATDLDNLVLLCHQHHHDHHDRGHDLRHRDGRWITSRGWSAQAPPWSAAPP